MRSSSRASVGVLGVRWASLGSSTEPRVAASWTTGTLSAVSGRDVAGSDGERGWVRWKCRRAPEGVTRSDDQEREEDQTWCQHGPPVSV
ncbi:hypothetical protein GCM10028771_12510 [Nocardioides marmoraquaticus]